MYNMNHDSTYYLQKLNGDKDNYGIGMESMIEEKTPHVQIKRKKISFADEVVGMISDIKVYAIEIDQNSLKLKQNS